MNKNNFSINIILLLIVIISLWTVPAFASNPPGWDEYEESGVNDEQTPTGSIESLLYITLAAGAIYGMLVLKKRRIQEQETW